MKQPLVVVVSGAPGSGKSTLARRLAADLGMPLLMRDDFKETLYDMLEPGAVPDAARSAELGQAAYALLYMVARRLLNAGVSVILESNFYRGVAERDLTPLLATAQLVQAHCGGAAEVILRRYRERAERGERHAGHNDVAVLPRLREYLASGRCEPIALDAPLLRVDTTLSEDASRYTPAFAEILAFVQGQGWSASASPGR